MSGPASFRTAVVAHTKRAEQAHLLMDNLGAVYLAMDDGSLGCGRNHRRAWQYLANHNPDPWGLVVEDDCEPVEGFNYQLQLILAAAPTPIVSLYLGTGYPPQLQDRIRQAVAAADREQAHWIVADNHLHGVGIAIRTELLPSMLDYVGKSSQPIDYAIRDWARNRGHRIAFSWPCIADHADTDTLTKHPDGGTRTIPRKAHRVGTREHWTRKAVML